MNALTPGRPRPARGGLPETEPTGGAGVRLTLDFDDDVPLDQLPDGGIDPGQFARQRKARAAGATDALADDGAPGKDAPGKDTLGEPARGGPAAGDPVQDRALPPDQPERSRRSGRRADPEDEAAIAAAGRVGRDRTAQEAGATGGARPGDAPADPETRRDPGLAQAPQPAADPADSWGDAAPGFGAPDTAPGSDREAVAPGRRNGPMGSGAAFAGHGGSGRPASAARASGALGGRIASIAVTLSVELGRQQVAIGELLASAPGQLFALDRLIDEPVGILVNGQLFARGEVVAIGDQFGVRLTELVDPED